MAAASILYDSDCGFCRWSLAQLLRLDRRDRLRPVPLQQPEADTLLSGTARDERMASWHLVDDGGQVYSGRDAFAPVLRLIAGGRPFAALLAAFPSVGDVAYRTVARPEVFAWAPDTCRERGPRATAHRGGDQSPSLR